MDQATCDAEFRQIAALLEPALDLDGPMQPDVTQPLYWHTPAAVRTLLGSAYLDATGAAASAGISGVFLGVAEPLWDDVVADGPTREMDQRLDVLLTAIRRACVDAMTSDDQIGFGYVSTSADRPERIDMVVQYRQVDAHSVVLVDTASSRLPDAAH